MLFDATGNRIEKAFDITTFLGLRSQNFIELKHTMGQGHMHFPSNTRVDIYRIADAGKEHLRAQAKSTNVQ